MEKAMGRTGNWSRTRKATCRPMIAWVETRGGERGSARTEEMGRKEEEEGELT